MLGSDFTMEYGPDGRLADVDLDGDEVTDFVYLYDHRNLRRFKLGPGVNVQFTYDLSGRLISEDTGLFTREYIYLQGQPVAMLVDDDGVDGDGADTYILGLDHLGTPMRAWDKSTGIFAWAADYEAFGRAWEFLPGSQSAPDIEVPLRFPGQYFDAETGLHYNWNRYYDPNTGRYLRTDPILTDPAQVPLWSMMFGTSHVAGQLADLLGVPGELQASTLAFAYWQGQPGSFTYAGGNPLGFVDFTGLLFGAEKCTVCTAFCLSLNLGSPLHGCWVFSLNTHGKIYQVDSYFVYFEDPPCLSCSPSCEQLEKWMQRSPPLSGTHAQPNGPVSQ